MLRTKLQHGRGSHEALPLPKSYCQLMVLGEEKSVFFRDVIPVGCPFTNGWAYHIYILAAPTSFSELRKWDMKLG